MLKDGESRKVCLQLNGAVHPEVGGDTFKGLEQK